MSRRWVAYADIMADRLGRSSEEPPANLSNCDGYGEQKKTIGFVKKAIYEKVGGDCFEEEGSNRNKRFRYIGKDNVLFIFRWREIRYRQTTEERPTQMCWRKKARRVASTHIICNTKIG